MNKRSFTSRPVVFEGADGLTMSSCEIADLTGNRHDDVMRDIRNMLETLDKDVAFNFMASYRGTSGRILPCFKLPKRECFILMACYDVSMRARIVDRWLELENDQRRRSDLDDPVVLRNLLLTHATKSLESQGQIKEMLPKVASHDRIAEAHGSFCRSTAAKMLGVPPQVLTRWMRTNGWTFRRPGDKDDLAYQRKIATGLLEHKITIGPRPDGSEWTSTQVRVTPKGLTVLTKAFRQAASAA